MSGLAHLELFTPQLFLEKSWKSKSNAATAGIGIAGAGSSGSAGNGGFKGQFQQQQKIPMPDLDKITAYTSISNDECALGDGEGFVYYVSRLGVECKLQVSSGKIDKLVYKNNNLVVLLQDDCVLDESYSVKEDKFIQTPEIRIIDVSERPKRLKLRSTDLFVKPLAYATSLDFSGDFKTFCVAGVTMEQIMENRKYLMGSYNSFSSPSQESGNNNYYGNNYGNNTNIEQGIEQKQYQRGINEIRPFNQVMINGSPFKISSTIVFISGDILTKPVGDKGKTATICGIVSNVVLVSAKLGHESKFIYMYFSTAPCYKTTIRLYDQYSTPLYKGEVYGTIINQKVKNIPRFIKLLDIGAMPDCMFGRRYSKVGHNSNYEGDLNDDLDKVIKDNTNINTNTNDAGIGAHIAQTGAITNKNIKNLGQAQQSDNSIQKTSRRVLNQMDDINDSNNDNKNGQITNKDITSASMLTVVTNDGIHRLGLQISDGSIFNNTKISTITSLFKSIDNIITNAKILKFNEPLSYNGMKQVARGDNNNIIIVSHNDVNGLEVNSILGYPIQFRKFGDICCLDIESKIISSEYNTLVKFLSYSNDRRPSIDCVARIDSKMRESMMAKYKMGNMNNTNNQDIIAIFDNIDSTSYNLINIKMRSEKECLEQVLANNMFEQATKFFSGRQTNQNKVAVYKKMADIKFDSGDYSGAMNWYLEAIKIYALLDQDAMIAEGYSFSTSEIIEHYVRKGQFTELSRMLELLLSVGKVSDENVTLLISIYVKNNDYKSIMKFVTNLENEMVKYWTEIYTEITNNKIIKKKKDKEEQNNKVMLVDKGVIMFNVSDILKILINNNYLLPALRLALISRNYGDAISILVYGKENRGQDLDEQSTMSKSFIKKEDAKYLKLIKDAGYNLLGEGKEQQSEIDNDMFPSIQGALALLCTFSIDEIHNHLLAVVNELLNKQPQKMAEFLCHLCTGWTECKYLPSYDEEENTTLVSPKEGINSSIKKAENMNIVIGQTGNINPSVNLRSGIGSNSTPTSNANSNPGSGTVSPVNAKDNETREVEKIITRMNELLKPFLRTWAKTYVTLRATESRILNLGGINKDSKRLQEIIDHINNRKELYNLIYNSGSDKSEGEILTRKNALGKTVRYLPLSMVLPYMIEHEDSVLKSSGDDSFLSRNANTIIKQLILTVTIYGVSDTQLKKVGSLAGIEPLNLSQIEQSVVHILLECLFREIYLAREEIKKLGGSIFEDTDDVIWGKVLEDNDTDININSSYIKKNTAEMIYNTRDQLATIYKQSTVLLLDILNKTMTPEETAERNAKNNKDGKKNIANIVESNLPYDPYHVLHLAKIYSYPPAALSVYIAKGDVLAQLNYYMDKKDTKAVLNVYFSSISSIERAVSENRYNMLDDNMMMMMMMRNGNQNSMGESYNLSNANKTSTQPLFWEEIVKYLVETRETEELNNFLDMISKQVDPRDIMEVMSAAPDKNKGQKQVSSVVYVSNSLLTAKEAIRKKVGFAENSLIDLDKNVNSKIDKISHKFWSKHDETSGLNLNKQTKNTQMDRNNSEYNSPVSTEKSKAVSRFREDRCCICNRIASFPIYVFKCGHVAHANCYANNNMMLMDGLSRLDKITEIPMYGLKTTQDSCSNYKSYCPKCVKERALPVTIQMDTVNDENIINCESLDSLFSMLGSEKYTMMSGGENE